MMKCEKLSHKDFMNQSFLMDESADWSNKTIVGTNLYQEIIGEFKGRINVLPDGVENLVLERCNLDNVLIPEGVTVIGGSNRVVLVQTDAEDWECDDDGNPIRPVNWKKYEKLGASTDPADLPDEQMEKSVLKEYSYGA